MGGYLFLEDSDDAVAKRARWMQVVAVYRVEYGGIMGDGRKG